MAPRLHVTVLIINCKCDVDVKLYNVLPYMYIHHECRSRMKAKKYFDRDRTAVGRNRGYDTATDFNRSVINCVSEKQSTSG